MKSNSNKTLSVAIIGSSGGGQATLGHTDTPELLRLIDAELKKIQEENSAGVTRALFVSLDGAKSFDNVDENNDQATLYRVEKTEQQHLQQAASHLDCHIETIDMLKKVNATCKKLNIELAEAIRQKEIHGLICISCSVDIFSETLQAAAESNIPVTGTGGTSLSSASSKFKIRLVGNAGGSVANTSLTRAVSYTHALAKDWQVDYRPWAHSTNSSSQLDNNCVPLKSVLNASLPAFWGVCLLKKLLLSALPLLARMPLVGDKLKLYESVAYHGILVLENHALPTACALVMATSTLSSSSSSSGKDISSVAMASILASSVCWRSVLGGLLAGRMVSLYQEKVLYWCIVNDIPATMTNLVTTGGVGAAIALVHIPVASILRQFTELIRWIIVESVSSNMISPSIAAFLWGCFSCYGSKVGWYHAVHLPIILIEMEYGNASFLGALDELTLVLVCAGVCFGTLVSARLLPKKDMMSSSDIALCQRAIYFNLIFGDFVEACYPFMEKHLLINIGGYIGSGLASVILVWTTISSNDESGTVRKVDDIPLSSAYLPVPVSIWLAGSSWQKMLFAAIVAFGIPCLFTILNYCLLRPTARQNHS